MPLDKREDENHIDDATRTLNIVHKLRSLLPQVFSQQRDGEGQEKTMIYHGDLSRSNILVDTNGNITGIVDWECVSALPLWKACSHPSLLHDRPREDEPQRDRYYYQGKVDELYDEHLLEYELTHLRRIFESEMEKLEPRWMATYNSSQLERDFDLAVENCDMEFLARDILAWMEDVAGGGEQVRSLRHRFDN